jgi:phenylpyruvate tautomerase PptA (4-oxalocrotonate tautomerase family)
MKNIEFIIKLISVLIPMVISLIYKMKVLNKRSIKNIKKRFDIYEKIITNVNNKVLSFTYLKEYLKFPISDDMIEYILSSTNFYDFVVVWKSIYTYVNYDSKTKKITYKKNKKPNRKLLVVLYIIFYMPLPLFVIFYDKLKENHELLIFLIILLIQFIIAVIFIWVEIGDITLAIDLVEKINNSNNDIYKQIEESPHTHVIIKTISGSSKESLQKVAKQICNIVNKTLRKPKKYISVSFDEYSSDEWKNVYKEFIEDKDNILIKPGYSDPKTFQ